MSLIYFSTVLFFIILVYCFNLNIDLIINIPGFVSSFYSTLFFTALFYGLSLLLIKKFIVKKGFLRLCQMFVVAFSIFLINRGMIITFYAIHNPRNTLTMYMIWLVVVSVFFVFEYYETLFIALFFLGAFAIFLPYFQHSTIEIVKNQFVSLALLFVFFFASRHLFSYRLHHFIQLKTIYEKNIEIENANHIKDEILGIVAHDLRNPLAVIESVAMLMETDISAANEDTRENLMMIRTSCEKARSIINDLLEAARNDSTDIMGGEETELNQFLDDIVKEWNYNKTDNVELIFKGTKKVYAYINKEKMHRVLDNLISNAIKFSADGNKIEVILKKTDENCIIEVKDFGLGIPDYMLPYVFDRFSKAGRKGVRGEDSIGMGLNIARQIVAKHGGDITVKSVEKKGTTFTIVLPQ